jgi:hypothetical protein
MKKAERVGDIGDWELFVAALSRYNILRNPIWTEEMSQKLYDYSAGITDIAVKLFIKAQMRALRAEVEILTPKLIEVVATEEFPWVMQAIGAIRTGNRKMLAKYEDLYFPEIKDPLDDINTSYIGSSNFNYQSQVSGNNIDEPGNRSKPDLDSAPVITPQRKRTRTQNASRSASDTSTLMQFASDAGKKKIGVYEALAAEGLIGSLDEYLV